MIFRIMYFDDSGKQLDSPPDDFVSADEADAVAIEYLAEYHAADYEIVVV